MLKSTAFGCTNLHEVDNQVEDSDNYSVVLLHVYDHSALFLHVQ